MKRTIAFLLLSIIGRLSISQNSYLDNWFYENCEFCKNSLIQRDSILSEIPTNAWHNAHVSFAHKDYKNASHYALKDHKTDTTLTRLLQGRVLLQLGIYDRAKYLLTHTPIYNDIGRQDFVYRSLGELYYKKKAYDSAIFYFQKALALTVERGCYFENEIQENLAFIMLSKKRFKKAETLYKALLDAYKEHHDSIPITRTYSNLGNLYFEQYEDEKAKRYFDSAYHISRPLHDMQLKRKIAYNLYLVSEALQQPQEALGYFKEYSGIKDSLEQQNIVWQVAQEKEAFAIAQKQAELDLKTTQRNTFIAISIAVIILLCIAYVFYGKLTKQHKHITNLNARLREMNTVKNKLFTIIAHDLRGPVAHLKQAFHTQATAKTQKASVVEDRLFKIIDGLSLLLDNLLNWALSQSDLLAVHKDWFPLWPVLYQIRQQYQAAITEKNIELSVKVPKSILIYGDMEIFKIAIRNCLDNAIKFTPEGGYIYISGSIEREVYTLNIKDTGIGIPEAVLKTVFEINADKIQKDTTGRRSSGLGLTLTRSMIQLNDGTVSITQNPQGGTIVSISIPFKKVT